MRQGPALTPHPFQRDFQNLLDPEKLGAQAKKKKVEDRKLFGVNASGTGGRGRIRWMLGYGGAVRVVMQQLSKVTCLIGTKLSEEISDSRWFSSKVSSQAGHFFYCGFMALNLNLKCSWHPRIIIPDNLLGEREYKVANTVSNFG